MIERRADARRAQRLFSALPLVCAECSRTSGLYSSGWRGYRADHPETDELPEIVFFCPRCAERMFG